jgi:predicted kinase
MVDNGVYSKDNEAFIVCIMQHMVREALQDGHNVVLDNTNLNSYHINWALDLAAEAKSEALLLTMNVSLDECIRRDLERSSGRVGKEVIMKLYNKYYINGVLDDYSERPVKSENYNY